MTVTTATISLVSTYTLNTDYTETDFNTYKAWAEEQFKAEDTGLSSVLADRAVALLICHYISLKSKGSSNKLSAKIGDTYFTYAQNVMPTSFLGEYQRLLKEAAGSNSVQVPYRGVERADKQTSTAFHLSEQKVPDMDSVDENLVEAELNNVDLGL